MFDILRARTCPFSVLRPGDLFLGRPETAARFLGIVVTAETGTKGYVALQQTPGGSTATWHPGIDAQGLDCTMLADRDEYSIRASGKSLLEGSRSRKPGSGSLMVEQSMVWLCCTGADALLTDRDALETMLVNTQGWSLEHGPLLDRKLVVDGWSILVEGRSVFDFEAVPQRQHTW